MNFLATTPWRGAALQAFKRDASFRQYFRLQAGPKPALLMDAPADKESITPFVTISEHLQKLGLSAPQIYQIDEKNGFVLLEDFGDQTFTRLLAARDIGKELETFSIVFPEDSEADESVYARYVANLIGSEHH